MVTQGPRRAYVWLFDSKCTWWNMVVAGAPAQQIGDATVELVGLEPGAYRIVWWDTHEGRAVREETARVAAAGAAEPAALRLRVPAFSRDVACKVIPAQ